MEQQTREPAAPAGRPRRSHWLGSLIALVALLGVGALAWHLTHRPASGAPGAGPGPGGAAPGARAGGPGGRGGPPSTVGVAVAERADIPVWLEALGTVTPAATVTVRPQVSGVLKQVLYREGETVRAGQLLATIDPRPFEMALMQAQGQRQRDEAQLENARLTLQRYRTLLQQDSIARQDVDTQAALVKQLEGTAITDRAAEGTARLNLAYTRITAPVAGRVGLRVVDAGNLVNTGDANGIAVITQVAPIDVSFAVPQDRVPEVQARASQGAQLPVTALDRSRTAELDQGHFLTLDNQVDVTTGTVRAKARFTNAKGTLFPNQFVNVRLLVNTLQGAVTVPVTAVRQSPNGDYVYVLKEDRTVSQRSITRGLTTAERAVITTGLQAGEKVITEGADRLRDGARVVLPGDRPASGAAMGGRRRASGAGAGGASDSPAAATPGERPASGAWGRRQRASAPSP
ncbi:MdtA/MuxA family multidrug efflux RND transporter periplasmic adaptor subunit [Ideonella sp. BN130291]|uniref:MdtA/MuxA family multidrug efflux RND transporter periplasmic adaptor subunit n=1 Tax=Ideonella sp. BN130291 TaxID=3112940 RepID=UPI002E272120|nr:MdtA/MuxA family multidrug efflux RND transporter periplasmic adaptor subunit [Ideonella sp. BN130291]